MGYSQMDGLFLFQGKSIYKWMITGGTPMTLETFICCIISETAGLMNPTVEKPSKLLYNWTLRPNM
jgi:hypothetical protein